jgi:PAS domain S-box-containing protein
VPLGVRCGAERIVCTVDFASGWKRLLGRDESEITLAELRDLVDPDDRANTASALPEYLQGRTSVYEIEQRMLHADGSYRWVLSRATVAYDSEGRPSHLLGADIDIAEGATFDADPGLPAKAVILGCNGNRCTGSNSGGPNVRTVPQ